MTRIRKKGIITPMPQPENATHMTSGKHGEHGQQAPETMPITDISPPAPDMNSPVFTTKNPSFVGGVFKSIVFCVPTAIVLMAVGLWYFQNITVRFIPEFKTVFETLYLVRKDADFRTVTNTPNTPTIATITQVSLNKAGNTADKTGTVFGVIYNTTPTPITNTTVILDFMTKNNTLISSQSHTIKTELKPNTHTAFSINLPHVPLYAHTIKIR